MTSSEELIRDYNKLKQSISHLVENNDFNDALGQIVLATQAAYTYNFIPTCSDTEIEEEIERIADKNFKPVQVDVENNTVLFYDYFGYDNRGLTQQYLRALMFLGKRIVYILEQTDGNFFESDIFNELNQYENKSIHILNKGIFLNKISQVLEILETEKPFRVLMHLAPWDVVAYAAFYLTKGIVRYQINLTDHAFWIGIRITDISLEFRNFGACLSAKKRGIKYSSVRILPYYPIINNKPFQGLPNKTKGKKIIFSGASVYKILGANLIFLKLIKKILDVDKELVFVFAGSGNTAAIENFVKLHKLEERFFLLGDRMDINEVMSNTHYYFTTFPFTGALTAQIGAACKLPIFSYNHLQHPFNDLSDLFYKSTGLLSYESIDAFIEGFKKKYRKDNELRDYGQKLNESIITPNEFAKSLEQIFNGGNPFLFLEKSIDIENSQACLSEYLIEIENEYNPQYKKMIANSLSPKFKNKIFKKYYRKEQRENLLYNKRGFVKNILLQFFPKKS